MVQERKPYAFRGDVQHLTPKESTQLTSGDYVVMPRNIDPISRAVLGTESRISPIATAWAAQWGVGIVDADFSADTHGATLYATPTAGTSIPVIRKGVVRLAVVQTSGQAGDLVIYSSGGTGAQLFTVNNYRRDIAVGRIFKTFSGATANDPQLVELIEKPISERDIYYWLQNRVLEGCSIKGHSDQSAQASSQINAGATGENNRVIIKGKVQSVARKTDFTLMAGASLMPGANDLRAYWIAVKVELTGSGVAFTKETCTIGITNIASYTHSSISAGCFIPKTWTSNMVPVALVLKFSATCVTMTNHIIMNIRSPQLPHGLLLGDHTKWYL